LQIKRYTGRISKAFLDRIDICIALEGGNLLNEGVDEYSTDKMCEMVDKAVQIQKKRFEKEDILTNSDMGERQIKKYCKLSKECEDILKNAYDNLHLSPRARSRIIKVARTIADMELFEEIQTQHILEAISYRHSQD
jgi:magnesium chelatase family protein